MNCTLYKRYTLWYVNYISTKLLFKNVKTIFSSKTTKTSQRLDLTCRLEVADSCFRWQTFFFFFETYGKNTLNFYSWPKLCKCKEGPDLISNLFSDFPDFLKMSLTHSSSCPKRRSSQCHPPEPVLVLPYCFLNHCFIWFHTSGGRWEAGRGPGSYG